jgi:chorismate synthase
VLLDHTRNIGRSHERNSVANIFGCAIKKVVLVNVYNFTVYNHVMRSVHSMKRKRSIPNKKKKKKREKRLFFDRFFFYFCR